MHNGFLRVASCTPVVKVADVDYNLQQIKGIIDALEKDRVELAVFPEMCLTAYTCADLFHNRTLLDASNEAFIKLCDYSSGLNICFVIGLPIETSGAVYNCAAVIYKGKAALVPKTYIPNYNEFYERRWWRPLEKNSEREVNIGNRHFIMSDKSVYEVHGVKFGVEICEDLWAPVPPSCHLAMAGAEVILNLSASDDLIGKYNYLKNLISQQSARCLCAYVYSSAGWGESSTDLVFDGKNIIAENGALLAVSPRWRRENSVEIVDVDIEALRRDRMHLTTFADCAQRENVNYDVIKLTCESESGVFAEPYNLMRHIGKHPFVPSDINNRKERCEEILNIQATGLAKRLEAIHCRSLVVGISGGLDSTLALLVAVKAFDYLGYDRKGITGITMPGFGTTSRTHSNALNLMDELGVTALEIPIGEAVKLHFKDIDHNPEEHDVTYENSQARERTQILMDMANKLNGIVLGTGDLSELALGWATYNGDHISMYGVNAGIPKTLVHYLVEYFATEEDVTSTARELLLDIIATPISPELIPAAETGEILQRTEDLVGPYELHDFFLYYMLRFGFSKERIYFLARNAFTEQEYDDATIRKWLDTFMRRFFAQQFKRSCLPDGPKVGSVCLSPRGDWRMPSDASSALWRGE